MAQVERMQNMSIQSPLVSATFARESESGVLGSLAVRRFVLGASADIGGVAKNSLENDYCFARMMEPITLPIFTFNALEIRKRE